MTATGVRFAAATDVGPGREENEDSLVLGGTVVTGAPHLVVEGSLALDANGPLVGVVDGMGGHRAGRLASALAARYMSSRGVLLRDHATPASAADDLLMACNQLLFDEMDRSPGTRGMGAAIAGLALVPHATVVFNLGDVAVFQYAGGYLLEVSESHRAPNGRLVQSLGGTPEPVALRPHVATHGSPPGTRWLICSDGLSDVVSFGDLERALAGPALVTIATTLLQAAIDGGSTDNISLIVVET